MWNCSHCNTQNWESADLCHKCGQGRADIVQAEAEEEEPLVSAIRQAAFGDLNHLWQLYQQTDGLENCLPIMEPDNLKSSIRSALDNLSQVCVSLIESIYEEAEKKVADPKTIRALRPSVRLQGELMQMMSCNIRRIELQISTYEQRFNRFLTTFQDTSDSAENNAYGAGAVGGVVGALILGPVGALLGGAAGGALSGHAANSNLQSEGTCLCQAFNEIISGTNDFLEEVAKKAIEAIVAYGTNLEAKAGIKLIE